MGIDEKKRQKKLMKKRQKDKARKRKQAQTAPPSSFSLKNTIFMARKFPVYECLINSSWNESGLADILISRRQPDGNLLFGVYLVDLFCLGLKNTFCNADFPVSNYKTGLRSKMCREHEMVECPLPLAHRIIYGSIEYAAQFGFKPNKDFKLSQYVLEDKNSIEPCEAIEFGKDGKPFFVAGPDDNAERIIKQLESIVGKGNFEFMYRLDM